MNFPIHQSGEQNFPSFNKPQIIGYFSLNGKDRTFSQDLSQLKYYKNNDHTTKTQVNFNLDDGINQVIRKPEYLDERIDHILKWILNNYNKIKADSKLKRWLKPQFVSFRGLITRICCTPYEKRDGWIICAAKFKGTIYLCEYPTDEEKYRRANLSKKDLQFMSWGYKFEQFLISDSPYNSPNTAQPVNEAEEFCCLFSTNLGQNSLLYGAEMDGICSETILEEPVDLKNFNFIELKTNRVITTKRQSENYRKKLLKWWCQSFLVGIENVICGTRTDQGEVFQLDNIKVSNMPKIAKNFWDASTCMNFCNNFFNHMRTIVTSEYNECIYKFQYKLDNHIEIQSLHASSEFSFIPDWFIEESNKIIKS